ncbi:MAG: exodeoxyribonuclease VII large subunit [Nitrospinota bacterium]|nr:exodeoxyribonuclease VII large subunit [Nitrospinota bacterium]
MTIDAQLRPQENGTRIYRVSELTGDIKAILEAAFDTVWLEGEISNFRLAASKHAYFILKDENAQIRCVMFRHSNASLSFQPADGDQVLLHGEVTIYNARGEYQIIVDQMEPRGLGALQKAFEQLKEKLAKEGLFDEVDKKEIPPFPWKVGVVTSPTGAVIQDMIHVITRRNSKVSILLYPVKVQGESAGLEIANAIKEMNRHNDIDVLIVGRGGGSIEDLWAFNTECVARAIHASRIPVVSAVGHETDFTIADFVADLRAPTPSAAAEQVVPILRDILGELNYLNRELVVSLKTLIENYRKNFRNFLGRRFFREPIQIIQPGFQRLDDVNRRIVRGLYQWLFIRKERLGRKIQKLYRVSPAEKVHLFKLRQMALRHQIIRQMISITRVNREKFEGVIKNFNTINPLTILERGYSICTEKIMGRAIKSSDQVRSGDPVGVRLSKGRLDCIVKKTIKG